MVENRGRGMRYAVFGTKWGHFGLCGGESGLFRTCLPVGSRSEAEVRLLAGLGLKSREDKGYMGEVQGLVSAYFEGVCVEFGEGIEIDWRGVSGFGRVVLEGCRGVMYGQTISYGELAERLGKSGAARAVGRVLGSNRLPLVIACHRVICADGRVGGYSAVGGWDLKRRLLLMESKRQ